MPHPTAPAVARLYCHADAMREARDGATRGIRAIALVRAANIRRKRAGLLAITVCDHFARRLGRAARRRGVRS